MNLFSKCSRTFKTMVVMALLLAGAQAEAVNINALYTAACQREIGVVIDVSKHKIKLLSLSGQVVEFRRHEVIFWAYYPLDQFPNPGRLKLKGVERFDLTTQVNNEIKDLVSGWPIGFTKDKVAFLSKAGKEVVISRRNIFGLEIEPTKKSVRIKNISSPNTYKFVHPYTFRECSTNDQSWSKKTTRKRTAVYPQQVLSQPVMIKRELDHLEEGYKQVRRYHREQSYYPVPEVYKNKTSLGLWQSFGSRHGASNKRPNNLTPFLVDDYSSDVFDYQHTMVTGSAPMYYSSHEEPQTQFYYAFKSSYFHFSAMLDPNLILVGRNYEWQAGAFDKEDDKSNLASMAEMGFDFGRFSFQLYLLNLEMVGIFANNTFYEDEVGVPRLGISYANHLYKLEVSGGAGSGEEVVSGVNNTIDMSLFRANFHAYFFDNFDLTYSFILKNLEYSGAFVYESQTMTNAVYVTVPWDRFDIGGFTSLERHKNDFGATTLNGSDESLYFKGGAFISLSF